MLALLERPGLGFELLEARLVGLLLDRLLDLPANFAVCRLALGLVAGGCRRAFGAPLRRLLALALGSRLGRRALLVGVLDAVGEVLVGLGAASLGRSAKAQRTSA